MVMAVDDDHETMLVRIYLLERIRQDGVFKDCEGSESVFHLDQCFLYFSLSRWTCSMGRISSFL